MEKKIIIGGAVGEYPEKANLEIGSAVKLVAIEDGFEIIREDSGIVVGIMVDPANKESGFLTIDEVINNTDYQNALYYITSRETVNVQRGRNNPRSKPLLALIASNVKPEEKAQTENEEVKIEEEKVIPIKKHINKTSKNLKEMIKEIVNQGIDTEENINDKLTYLKENKIPDILVEAIFNSYKKYDEQFVSLIRNPSTKFKGKETVLSCLEEVMAGHNINLVGEKGTGKNVLARTLSWLLNRPIIEMSSSGQSEIAEFLGDRTIETKEDGTMKMSFELGALSLALKYDFIILIDELNALPADVQLGFNSVFDKRKEVYVKFFGVVKGGDNFFGIITQNEGYYGTKQLNEAFRDRFSCIELEAAKSIIPVLKSEVPEASTELLETADKIFKGIHSKIREGLISMDSLSIRAFISALESIVKWNSEPKSKFSQILGGAAKKEDKQQIIDEICACYEDESIVI